MILNTSVFPIGFAPQGMQRRASSRIATKNKRMDESWQPKLFGKKANQ